jgi:DNA repair protein RecO
MIIRSHAIVLRRIDFQESSCIVTFFTKEQGKCGLLAKGARALKSKFAGKLEPGNLVELIYQHKPARSIQWLNEVQVLTHRSAGGDALHHYLVRVALADLVLRLLDDHQVNTTLFDQVAGVLRWLQGTEVDPLPVFPYIMIRLAAWMGVGLQLSDRQLSDLSISDPSLTDLSLTDLSLSDLSLGQGYPHQLSLNPERGTVQRDHSLNGYLLSEAMYRYVHQALHGEKKSILQSELSNAEIRQLVYILDAYFSFHFDGIKPRTTEILFDTFQDITL